MKIFIVGLGLIGASYAKALSKHHDIFGYDINEDTMDYAYQQKIIQSKDFKAITTCEVIIFALYPKTTLEFIKTHRDDLKNAQLITDVSGVKHSLVSQIEALLTPLNIPYLSHHPMAGKETNGIKESDEHLFLNKKALIIQSDNVSTKTHELLETLLYQLQFEAVYTVDKTTHDLMIAKTSQLPHILALALIDITDQETIKKTAANSFSDLTRIANINVDLWLELFLENNQALSTSIEALIDSLQTFNHLIKSQNSPTLKTTMETIKNKKTRM